jgi:formylglycine-generating enzyme
MKTMYISLFIFLFSLLWATSPVVTNVTVVQRTDGSRLVDIYYDVEDTDGDSLLVSICLSPNAGQSFTITPIVANLSGDVGAGILPGTGRHIVWNIGAESIILDGSNFQLAVIADDGYCAAPIFSPIGGAYTSAQCVTISCSTIGASIRYTTNGSDPVPSSTLYTIPILVSVTTTVKARAFKNGMTASVVKSELYTIQASPSGDFVTVQGGTFQMGSDDPYYGAPPIHSVTLNSFSISRHEVTQSEWQAATGNNPSIFSGYPSHPVENISWYDCINFCNLLSLAEELTPVYSINGSTNPVNWGAVPDFQHPNPAWDNAICNWTANGYRLPTESEWEFAARGGNLSHGYTYSGSNSTVVGWHDDDHTHDVMGLPANELGIFDMSGNVGERCWDWYETYPSTAQNNPTGPSTGSFRIVRGGSCDNREWYLRVYSRGGAHYTGLRLCRTLD